MAGGSIHEHYEASARDAGTAAAARQRCAMFTSTAAAAAAAAAAAVADWRPPVQKTARVGLWGKGRLAASESGRRDGIERSSTLRGTHITRRGNRCNMLERSLVDSKRSRWVTMMRDDDKPYQFFFMLSRSSCSRDDFHVRS